MLKFYKYKLEGSSDAKKVDIEVKCNRRDEFDGDQHVDDYKLAKDRTKRMIRALERHGYVKLIILSA